MNSNLRFHCRRHGAQRGAAALAVTAALAIALLLVVAWTQRHVVTELAAAAQDQRRAQAFEAAEAGVAWALAALNDDAPRDKRCEPSASPSDLSFRDGRLHLDAVNGRLTPTTWNDAGADAPLAAACVRGDDGWHCSCPRVGEARVDTVAPTRATPSFRVELRPGDAVGVIRVVSSGCLRADAACSADTDRPHDSAARVERQVALLPALPRRPDASLVVGGEVDAGVAAVVVQGAGAVALRSGGRVVGDAIVLRVPAESDPGGALAPGDASLAALDADRFFARWFGMSRAAWAAQPAATRIACRDACGNDALAALARGARLLAVDGDLELVGPLALGRHDRPVALVVSGALRLRGHVNIHGVVAAASLDWRGAGSPAAASVRGATLVHGNVATDAAVTFAGDAAVIASLRRTAGSLVAIDGSWKDF